MEEHYINRTYFIIIIIMISSVLTLILTSAHSEFKPFNFDIKILVI